MKDDKTENSRLLSDHSACQACDPPCEPGTLPVDPAQRLAALELLWAHVVELGLARPELCTDDDEHEPTGEPDQWGCCEGHGWCWNYPGARLRAALEETVDLCNSLREYAPTLNMAAEKRLRDSLALLGRREGPERRRGVVDVIEHRLHWHQPDEQPPERVTFWRGGIRADRPRWEQEYVRADLHAGAVVLLDDLADVLADVRAGVVPADGSVVRGVLKRATSHANGGEA